MLCIYYEIISNPTGKGQAGKADAGKREEVERHLSAGGSSVR